MIDKKLFYPFSVFVGTIIGVGLFSLPYVTLKSGVLSVLVYFILGGLFVIFIHLLFGEVVLRTHGTHRLPGYVDIYLGKKSKKVILLTTLFGFYGVLLVYLIVGSGFLWGLLNPLLGGNKLVYTIIFFITGSFLIWRGSQSIAKAELWFLGLFFVLLLFLGIKSGHQISLENFGFFNFEEIFLPYGVVIFSLWGIAVIPEVRDLLKGNEKSMTKVIVSGIVLSAITYLFFIFIVLGVSGINTTEEAFLGLKNFLPSSIVGLGLFFGVITTFTSFLTLGLTLKKIFHFDYHLPINLSCLLACGVPFVLFLFGLDGFIKIIGFVGAVVLGIEGSLVLLMHQKAKKLGKRNNPEYEIKISLGTTYVLIALLIIGVILEIFYSI